MDRTRTYNYDKMGNLVKSIDRNGREIKYVYDDLNRNTTEIWLDNGGQGIHQFDYVYNAASELISASDSNSSYGYAYDFAGRLISVDNAGTPTVPNVVFTYGYDEANNLTSVTDTIIASSFEKNTWNQTSVVHILESMLERNMLKKH